MNMSDQTPFTLTSDEELLLDFIIKERIKRIKPIITISEIKYEGLEEFMSENGYDWDLLRDILSLLENKGLLKIKGDIRTFICPKCNSPHISSKYSSIKCQSIKLSKVELIEHKICGHTATRDKFLGPSGLICPNCDKQINPPVNQQEERHTRAKKEFEIIGSAFECENCGQRLERPNIVHICQDCGTNFNYKLGRYEKFPIYETNMNVINKLSDKDDINVLLIEDNPDDAEIIRINLEKSNISYIVDVATTGKKGINKIEEKHYDIILLDYVLPDITGINLIEKIKKIKIKTPIIILTGTDDREVAVLAMKLGASDYLIKSVDLFSKLPNVIMKITQNHQLDKA
jgi:CheY-like chemotaxis protein